MGDKIVVANTGDDSLSIIDCHNWIEKRIYMPLDSGPYALVKAKDPSYIFVSQYYADSLSYVNIYNENIEKTLFLGRRPSYMAVDVSKDYIYISNMDSDSISIVTMDDARLIGQIEVGSMPQGIDCDSDNNVLVVANTDSNSIYIINTLDYGILKTIKLEVYPYQVKYSADGRRIFIGCYSHDNYDQGSMIVVNTDDYSIDCEIHLEGVPGEIYETRDGKILAASMGKGGVQILDLRKGEVIRSIPTNGMTHGIAVDMEEKYVYVTNPDDNSVSIVDLNKGRKLVNIPVGKEPNGILFIPDGP